MRKLVYLSLVAATALAACAHSPARSAFVVRCGARTYRVTCEPAPNSGFVCFNQDGTPAKFPAGGTCSVYEAP